MPPMPTIPAPRRPRLPNHPTANFIAAFCGMPALMASIESGFASQCEVAETAGQTPRFGVAFCGMPALMASIAPASMPPFRALAMNGRGRVFLAAFRGVVAFSASSARARLPAGLQPAAPPCDTSAPRAHFFLWHAVAWLLCSARFPAAFCGMVASSAMSTDPASPPAPHLRRTSRTASYAPRAKYPVANCGMPCCSLCTLPRASLCASLCASPGVSPGVSPGATGSPLPHREVRRATRRAFDPSRARAI